MPTFLILLLVAFSIFLIGIFVFRPQVTTTRGGKMMAFLALFALPLLCFGMGASGELEHAKSTEFCLSCHIMEKCLSIINRKNSNKNKLVVAEATKARQYAPFRTTPMYLN